jgi:rod shape-determining protein MreB
MMRVRRVVAIDLGTRNTLVYVRRRGIVIDEPSVIAFYRGTQKVAAVGTRAELLAGKEPADIRVVHPLHNGVITDLEATTLMLQSFLRRRHLRRRVLKSRAVVCVPSGATHVERQAVINVLSTRRPRYVVRLVEEAIAAAAGAGVDPLGEKGVLVVDVGGGTTEVALIMSGAKVRARSIRLGGNAMDEAIVQAIKTELGLVVGLHTAEQLKIALGLTSGESDFRPVTGIDAARGTVREEKVHGDLVAAALERSVTTISNAVDQLVSEMPPDLASDVVEVKIRLTGGGALLLGLAARIQASTGIGTEVVDDPLRCVVRGAATILDRGGGFDRASDS